MNHRIATMLLFAASVGLVSTSGLLAEEVPLSTFKKEGAGAVMPEGWERWLSSASPKLTRYKLVVDGKSAHLRALSSGSGSGLVKRVDVDLAVTPKLAWSWRALEQPSGADLGRTASDDAAARVCALFGDNAPPEETPEPMMGHEGEEPPVAQTPPIAPTIPAPPVPPTAPIEPAESMPPIAPMAEAVPPAPPEPIISNLGPTIPELSGAPRATHALCYVWTEGGKVNDLIAPPDAPQVRYLVAETGRGRRSVGEEHDLVADFQKAFGTAPGPLVAVGLVTDSDATNSGASAYYGELVLRGKR